MTFLSLPECCFCGAKCIFFFQAADMAWPARGCSRREHFSFFWRYRGLQPPSSAALCEQLPLLWGDTRRLPSTVLVRSSFSRSPHLRWLPPSSPNPSWVPGHRGGSRANTWERHYLSKDSASQSRAYSRQWYVLRMKMCCRLWKWEVSYSFCFFFASSWVTMHLSQRPARSLEENPWPAACCHAVPMGEISS